jgi:Uma2 family endonuclease
MATSVEEIEKNKKQAEIPPTRRDYFTIAEFKEVRKALPDHVLELINGEIVINKRSPHDYFSIEDFKIIAETLPDHRLELINGELVMSPKPDKRHQKHARRINTLLGLHAAEIVAIGCEIDGGNAFFEIPEELSKQLANESGGGPSDVCPDASVCYRDYLETDRRPPALLVVEVLSDSNRQNLERDLKTKALVYAALEIPAYWVIDRRDQSVWAHTEPRDGEYTVCKQIEGDQVLPAPGLEFLRITPEQIFAG